MFYIEGYSSSVPLSSNLGAEDFELEMLEEPKFMIENMAMSVVGSEVSVSTDIIANDQLDHAEYVVHAVVVEDSLTYPSGVDEIYSLMRKMIPDHGGTIYSQAWTTGETVNVSDSWDMGNGFSNTYTPSRFELVVFVQNSYTKEIYQAASTRDITVYLNLLSNGEVAEEVQQQAKEVSGMKVYPNPATDYVNVSFDAPLSQDYDWRMVDVCGVMVKQGIAQQGTQNFTIQNYELPTGMYFLIMHTDDFFTQRKVIIRND